MSFIEEHMRHSLRDHVLEPLEGLGGADSPVTAYYLKPPKKTRLMATLIVFTPEGIALMGDLTPSHNGNISSRGYGEGWFSGKLSERYLCEKFLQKEFVPEVAYKWLREHILDMRRDTSFTKEKARELWDELHRLNKYGELNPQSYYDLFTDNHLDYDGEGYDYNPGAAGWLCLIQQKFAELKSGLQTSVSSPEGGEEAKA